MLDTDLYRHLLGLAMPWTVARVELKVKEQRVDVWAEHSAGVRWPCPECQRELPLYDHADERTWRHLDSCQFLTYLHARPPRVNCPKDGARSPLALSPLLRRASRRAVPVSAITRTAQEEDLGAGAPGADDVAE